MKIFDHIHGFINICPSAKRILDTLEFQRLRNIKQLGCVYLVFPSASHNRFEHSLGVYNLSRIYMDKLNEKGLYFDKREYELISVASLIHDLGHGPFSHLFDNYVTDTEHEYRSIEIFKIMNNLYNLGYSNNDIKFIYDVIHPPKNIDNEKKYIYQIVSNKNGIDVDRFDYMLRDIKMTGIENRYNIDYTTLLYIMDNTYIHNNELVYNSDIKTIIDMFFQTRCMIYKKICNHKTVKSLEIMMGEILINLEDTFHINDSIKKNDWDKFCTCSDTIVNSLDFLSSRSKENDYAFKLYNRIKTRNIYKLVVDDVIYEKNILENKITELKDKYNNNEYLVNVSTIRYYSDEYPKFIHDNKLVNFAFTGNDMYLIKVFKK